MNMASLKRLNKAGGLNGNFEVRLNNYSLASVITYTNGFMALKSIEQRIELGKAGMVESLTNGKVRFTIDQKNAGRVLPTALDSMLRYKTAKPIIKVSRQTLIDLLRCMTSETVELSIDNATNRNPLKIKGKRDIGIIMGVK